MADVFISYHEKSAGELAAQIADALESAGISCWYAKRDIPPGGDFARYIPPQIDACKVFLLILNDDAVYQSRHIENELGLAFGRMNKQGNITIVPLELEGFTRKEWIKYYLVHAQSVKFQNAEELAKKIGGILQSTFDNIPVGSFVLENIATGKMEPFPLKDVSSPAITSGDCGDNATYALVNGALTVSGAGLMRNYNFDERTMSCNTPWWNMRQTISSVRIQDGVTSIGAFAFNSCANLSRVEIPDSVTEICAEAFYRCRSLREIQIPDSVKFIRKFAFDETGLTEISIPKNAKTDWRTFPKGARVTRRA